MSTPATNKPHRDAEKARRQAAGYNTPRFLALNTLDAYVAGDQYAGRPGMHEESDRPLRERAPSIVYPIAQNAIRSNSDFVLGEGRWPSITSFTSEDDRAFDEDFGLDEDDSKILDKFVGKVVEQARMRAGMREMLDAAQGCGSSVGVCKIADGKLTLETVRAAWCTPTFSQDRPGVVTSLEILYAYIDTTYDAQAKEFVDRCLLYRRVIDETSDTAFKPAVALDDGQMPRFVPDVAVAHGFGFCPVIWYRFLPGALKPNELDGEAVHAYLLDEIDSLNFALSARDRAAFFAACPPIVETGVEEGATPAEMGREAVVINRAGSPGPNGAPRKHDSYGVDAPKGRRRAARVLRPGAVWTYENSAARAGYMTLPGDALAAVDANIADLKAKILESLAVVDIDVENAKTALDASGKAQAMAHERQLKHCRVIREDFGNNCLLATIDMFLRIVLVKGANAGIYIAGLKKVLPILARFQRQVANDQGQTATRWFPPHIDLVWGPFFENSATDEQAIITGTTAMLDAKLITRKLAVQRLAAEGIITCNSADELIEAVDAEKAEAMDSMTASLERLKAAGGSNGAGDDAEGDADPSAQKAAPKPPPFAPKSAAA